MHRKVAVIAASVASALIAGCGGASTGGDSGSTGSNPGSVGSAGGTASSSGTASSAASPPPAPIATSPAASCASGSQFSSSHAGDTTVVGGELFVAEQGPIQVTLLSVNGLRMGDPLGDEYRFEILYDVVFGATLSNSQNHYRWAMPFPAGTPIGTCARLEFERPLDEMTFYTPLPATYPKGAPFQLWLMGDPGSTTASIGKDLGHNYANWVTATVRYGPNNTATVTFRCLSCGDLTVGLTNVSSSH